jgi:translocating chain-associated membrane protein 1
MALSAPKKRSSSKNPNYFSHEFIIQNHGDIVTCFFMVFIVGLMFQVTTPLASMFVTPKYNITELNQTDTPILYMYGWQDITLTLFYSLACIIFHAVIQEYVLDVSKLDFLFFFKGDFSIKYFYSLQENYQKI